MQDADAQTQPRHAAAGVFISGRRIWGIRACYGSMDQAWDCDGRSKVPGEKTRASGRAVWGQRLPLHRHKGLGRRERAKRKVLAFLAVSWHRLASGCDGEDSEGPGAVPVLCHASKSLLVPPNTATRRSAAAHTMPSCAKPCQALAPLARCPPGALRLASWPVALVAPVAVARSGRRLRDLLRVACESVESRRGEGTILSHPLATAPVCVRLVPFSVASSLLFPWSHLALLAVLRRGATLVWCRHACHACYRSSCSCCSSCFSIRCTYKT
ncbi:hypothetical protein J3F83DRAFT_318123 [Trichoderma novae-zelandiae]